MATLILPYPAFTAGTPAVAAEVQNNFTTIRDHINGQNIGTANIETTLVSRVGGPILFLNQASQEQVALSILNSRTKSALQITQSAVLGAGSSIIAIDDNATQTTGDAQLYINTQIGSTIPAIKVNHGSDVTMSLTKTQLDLFNSAVQATSAGVVSATTANLTTLNATDVNTTNITATGLLDLTAPASDAIVAEIKGRSSDNNAIVQFKSNDDATVYASATSSPSGLTLNLPDTADSYDFKVNNQSKVSISDTKTVIKGRTDGSAPGSDEIGYIQTAAFGDQGNLFVNGNSQPYVLNTGITLNKGVWLVTGTWQFRELGGPDFNHLYYAYFQLTNGTTFGQTPGQYGSLHVVGTTALINVTQDSQALSLRFQVNAITFGNYNLHALSSVYGGRAATISAVRIA